MFIAPQTSFDIVAPPFAPGSASNGKGGWSRSPGLVVELDAYDSGAEEQDGGGGEHVAVFLSGGKICETNVGVSFASGEAYTVWIDYDGFGTKLYVSMSTSGTRPSAPTLTCLVDVWATLDMSVDHYVGFSAYNPTDATGSVHELVESLSIADGYRPFDSSECGSYAKCSERGAQGLCVADLNGAGSCEVIACKGGWIWDVAGADCCAFLERSLWTSDIAAGSVSVGTTVSCVQQRRVMGYVTSADKCA